eukprot:Skav214139  [mRNA]  locus=scaffold1645:85607:86539:- [translate_table: standard]
MSALAQFPSVEGGLAFQCDKNGCISLCTFYSVVVASVDQASKLGASYQDLIFKCSVHDFQAESFSEHPNLLIRKQPFAEFWLGNDCAPVRNTTSKGDKEKVVLPFGLENFQRGKAKKRPAPSTFDCDPRSRKKTAEENKNKTATKNKDDDAQDFDDEDIFLSSDQVEQLKLAMRAAAGSLEDDDATMKEQQQTHPEPNQSQPDQCKRQPTFFNTRLGIISIKEAKRIMKCYFCSNEICKHSLRFEYAFSVSKPQRSIHVECVGQIASNSEALKSSISWLQRELEFDQSMTLQRTALTEALHSLQSIDAAN